MISSNSPVCVTSDNFAQQMLGKPWVDRACSYDFVDCWGLVVMYFRRVNGINIHHDDGYSSGLSFATCYSSEVCFWRPEEHAVPGGIFVSFTGSNPTHVGLVYPGGKILHARQNSAVRFDRIRTLEKLSTRVEWFTYAGDKHSEGSGPS